MKAKQKHNSTKHNFPISPSAETYTPWLDNYDPKVAKTINHAEVPLYYYLDVAAQEVPNKMAICFQNTSITYAQLQNLAEIMAANLKAQGIEPGDRVAIMLPNLPQTFLAFWAIIKAGGIVVMTNPLYMEKEILHQLNDADAKVLITFDRCWPKIEPLRAKLTVKKYFVTRLSESLRFPLNMLFTIKNLKSSIPVNFDNESVLPFKTLLVGQTRLSVPILDPKNTLAALQYTGGTTGTPKGAMLTHYNFTSNIEQASATLFYGEKNKERFLSLLPFFHVYGLSTCLLLPIALQATIYPMVQFSPSETLKNIDKYKITCFPGAPAAYIAIMQQKDMCKYSMESLRYCISGSAPMPIEYIRLYKEKTPVSIVEGYGLTEASPITHLNHQINQKPGTIGMPLPGTEVKIVDSEVGALPMPVGAPGELIVRGPQVMQGYWKRPDETANSLRNGWLYTGDIAIMDEEGFFTIVDRKKDMVIVGGYNIFPREIDEVLYTHPKIQDAVSVGIPNKARGETLKAYIILKAGEELTRAEVISYCRSKLANYKVPKQIEFRSELPRTAAGKVLRRALREEEEKKLADNTAPIKL